MAFWPLFLALATFALQLLLMPKPQNAKPAALEDFNLPTAEEGREIPVLFGTRVLKGPNVTWYGNLRVSPIKGKRRYGLFGPKQVIGYEYYLGIHMVLCHGCADYISEINVGNKRIFTGYHHGGAGLLGPEYINRANLFGGSGTGGEGGIRGWIDVELGALDQPQNAYLVSKLGSTISAHRGVVGVVLNQVYLGTSPYIKPWEFVTQRILKTSACEDQWYKAKARIARGPLHPTSVHFAFDRSSSMFGIDTVPSKPRAIGEQVAFVDTLKVLQFQLQQDEDFRLDILISLFGVGNPSSYLELQEISFINASEADIDECIAFINGIRFGGNTEMHLATDRAATWFEQTRLDKELVERLFILVTDGQPNAYSPQRNAQEEVDFIFTNPVWADIYDLYSGDFSVEHDTAVSCHIVNFALDDITYSLQLDNTTIDGVPIIDWNDVSGLTEIITFPFVGKYADMNPAHIIRECLTDPVWGMGYNASDIDDDSFTLAADALYDEFFGLTLLWQREEEIGEFVSTVLAHIDAYCYTSISTGKFVLRLIRDDYDGAAIPVLTEDDIVSWVELDRRQPSEVINTVVLKFFDKERHEDGSLTVHNQAQIAQVNGIISTTKNYPGIGWPRLASRVGLRDLKSLGAGLITGTINTKRTTETFNPADAFRIHAPRHGLFGEVFRVVESKRGDGRSNTITLKIIQDVFSLGGFEDVIVATGAGGWVDPSNDPDPVTVRLVDEMSYRDFVIMLGITDVTSALAADPDVGMLGASGVAPTSDAVDAIVAIDEGAGYVELPEYLNFAPGANLSAALAADDTTVLLTNDFDLDTIDVGSIAAFVGLPPAAPSEPYPVSAIHVEYIRVDAVDTVASTMTISRGCLDTVPSPYVVGTGVIVFEDFIFTDLDLRSASASFPSIDVKLKTLTGQGALSEEAAPVDTVVFNSRALRPYRPADVQINGVGSGIPELGGVNPIPVTWARRNRLTESTTSPLIWADGDVAPEAGQTTTVELKDFYGAILHTYSGAAGTLQNVDPADFAGEVEGYINVYSVRDGYDSWQSYELPVFVESLNLLLEDGDRLLMEDGSPIRLG